MSTNRFRDSQSPALDKQLGCRKDAGLNSEAAVCGKRSLTQQSGWRTQGRTRSLVFILNVFHMQSFDEVFWLMAMCSPPDEAWSQVSRKKKARPSVCVCVCLRGRPRGVGVGGGLGRTERRRGSVGGGDIKAEGKWAPLVQTKAGRGVQVKRDLPCDRECLAYPTRLAPFSFSPIQLYQAPIVTTADTWSRLQSCGLTSQQRRTKSPVKQIKMKLYITFNNKVGDDSGFVGHILDLDTQRSVEQAGAGRCGQTVECSRGLFDIRSVFGARTLGTQSEASERPGLCLLSTQANKYQAVPIQELQNSEGVNAVGRHSTLECETGSAMLPSDELTLLPARRVGPHVTLRDTGVHLCSESILSGELQRDCV
ncbi:unnamed protein product [Pleuronectes platessa]|uniref:Uncharacterized protein n=1 Tax=Pleuronectes platessa TaxID=8262 RepID=A0A9N7UIM2_PLEPL|nr:unnamed protein product [Pleuronectes platessa]